MPDLMGDMSTSPERSQPLARVYVMRLWQEPDSLTGVSAWRASLFSPVRRRSRFFSDVAQLCVYLQELNPTWPEVRATPVGADGEGGGK